METKKIDNGVAPLLTNGEGEAVPRREIAALLGGAIGALTLSACTKEAESALLEPNKQVGEALTGGNFLWVDSIAGASPNLRTVSGDTTRKPVAVVGGYYNAGDGGGGVFYWQTSSTSVTDDGGTILVFGGTGPGSTGTSYWQRILPEVLNVRCFGAKGDRMTPDSAAFTNAIAAMNPARYLSGPDVNLAAGRVLRVPPGEYVIGNVVIDKQIWLQGETTSGTPGSTVLLVQDGCNGLILQHESVTCPMGTACTPLSDGTILSNLAIRGLTSNTLDAIQIFAAQVTVRDVSIDKFGGNGITIDSSQSHAANKNVQLWRIENCNIQECGLSQPSDPTKGCGLYVADGNGMNGGANGVGLCVSTIFELNYWWGVWDNSQIMNTFVACVFQQNGHAFNSTTQQFTQGGAVRVGNASTNSGGQNGSTFISCYVEPGQSCDLSVGVPFVVGGSMSGAVGVGDTTVPRVSSLGSRLFFRDFNPLSPPAAGTKGVFTAQISDAVHSQSALWFRYAQLADFNSSSVPSVTWGLQRFKPGNDSLSEYPPNGTSPFNPDSYAFDRCWAFRWVDNGLDPTIIPFGWTDGNHPRGAGYPFFYKPTINQRAHFSTTAALLPQGTNPALPANTTVVTQIGPYAWLGPTNGGVESGADLAAHFSVRLDPSVSIVPSPNTSGPASSSNANVKITGYQIVPYGGNNFVCYVAITNDSSVPVNSATLVATFEQFKTWYSSGSF